MFSCTETNSNQLKMEVMAGWMQAEWFPLYPSADLLTLMIPDCCLDESVLGKFDLSRVLPGDFRYCGREPLECPVVIRVDNYNHDGDLTERTGAFRYRFTHETGAGLDILVLGSHFTNSGWNIVCVAAVPKAFLPAWTDFSNECVRLNTALEPGEKVIIIGGRAPSFVPAVTWDQIVLPAKLKDDIMDDIQSFFRKGIEVYKRLNLKPFRKLLLAGIPGTGKTMICSALAKWSLEQNFLVIYISSAYRSPDEEHGSSFGKIQRALTVAANSDQPTLILLEELDAYLHDEEKALVLNVLDGSESSINDKGTLLIATTNYPEAIDERILKRPGRLDRIFIIPEAREQADAEKMLRQYLGSMWQDEHRALVPHLVGYPGAFIREVAVHALTQVAYEDMTELAWEILEQSFEGLKEQIDARDDFLTRRALTIGFSVPHYNGN
jgi:hypothetical protein